MTDDARLKRHLKRLARIEADTKLPSDIDVFGLRDRGWIWIVESSADGIPYPLLTEAGCAVLGRPTDGPKHTYPPSRRSWWQRLWRAFL